MSSQDINFVKFLRGTEQQYENLPVKDKNTLYFIYDKTSTEENPTGKLYLEKFLIGGNSADLHSLSLKDLTDTNIGTPGLGDILQFNGSKWQPVLLSDILSDLNLDGTIVHSGIIQNSGETELEAIKRVFENTSNPGDIGILQDGTVYLSESNNNWLKLIDGEVRNANISGITQDISTIQSSLTNIYTKDETENKINQIIAGKNHLTYEVIADISDIDISDINNKNKVFLILKDQDDQAAGNIYDEYMIIGDNNPSLEKIGDWQADLTNYIQAGDSRLLTPEQKQKLDNLVIEDDGSIAISGKVNAENVIGLEDFINQYQFIKDVDNNIFNVTNAGKLELNNEYVTTSFFESTVGNLEDLLNPVSAENNTLVNEINTIKESIVWQEMQ